MIGINPMTRAGEIGLRPSTFSMVGGRRGRMPTDQGRAQRAYVTVVVTELGPNF